MVLLKEVIISPPFLVDVVDKVPFGYRLGDIGIEFNIQISDGLIFYWRGFLDFIFLLLLYLCGGCFGNFLLLFLWRGIRIAPNALPFHVLQRFSDSELPLHVMIIKYYPVLWL